MGNRGRILVVDDDKFYQNFCADLLKEEGYQVHTTFTGQEALALIPEKEFDLMILDLVMPGMGGIEVLENAKQIRPDLEVIIMTGYASVESAVKCLKAGAIDYLIKPLNPEELKITVKRAIELRHLFDEHQEMKNLLTIYEAIQRVSSCLELDRIYRLGLDALLIATRSEFGLSIFYEQEEELKFWVGLEEEDARAVYEQLNPELQPLPSRIKIIPAQKIIKENSPLEYLRVSSVAIFPFRILDRLEGAMVLLSRREFSENLELGNVRFVYEQIRSSLENAIRYQDAQRLIFIDDLTGLFNTRYLEMVLQTELSRARRFKKHLSLLFIDLDYFKLVNDTYGHLVGSWVLVETAQVLKGCLRDIDIVIRYGGDEFIIILSETDRQGATVVAERIRKRIEEHTFRPREDMEIHLTCCVGIAVYPEDAESKEELIQLADKAMYRGKETTRNVVYSAHTL